MCMIVHGYLTGVQTEALRNLLGLQHAVRFDHPEEATAVYAHDNWPVMRASRALINVRMPPPKGFHSPSRAISASDAMKNLREGYRWVTC